MSAYRSRSSCSFARAASSLPPSSLPRPLQEARSCRNLQARLGLAYLFISHDLKVVRAMSHRILVMRDGKVVESGETEGLFADPREPYTRALLRAATELAVDEAAAVRQ